MRTLALPKAAEPWSLTSLRKKLIEIGATVVSHGCYVTSQMAEIAVPCGMFARNPLADRAVAGTAGTSVTVRRRQMGEITTAEVRLDAGKNSAFSRLDARNWLFRPRPAPAMRDHRCQ
jgi:hypothetical protein